MHGTFGIAFPLPRKRGSEYWIDSWTDSRQVGAQAGLNPMQRRMRRLERKISVGVLAVKNAQTGHDDDLEIERETPIA
jgi:hypothetical protein